MAKIARFKWTIALILIGMALNAWALVALIRVVQEPGNSFQGPGESRIHITKPGDHTLWHESHTYMDGKLALFPDTLPPGTSFQVTRVSDNSVVPLRFSTDDRWTHGNIHRVSVSELNFETPGEYQILVSGLQEKRAFYLAEVKMMRILVSSAISLLGILFLFAGIGTGVYVLMQMSRTH